MEILPTMIDKKSLTYGAIALFVTFVYTLVRRLTFLDPINVAFFKELLGFTGIILSTTSLFTLISPLILTLSLTTSLLFFAFTVFTPESNLLLALFYVGGFIIAYPLASFLRQKYADKVTALSVAFSLALLVVSRLVSYTTWITSLQNHSYVLPPYALFVSLYIVVSYFLARKKSAQPLSNTLPPMQTYNTQL